MGGAIAARKHFYRHALVRIFEEECVRRHIIAGAVDQARALQPEHGWKRHPLRRQYRPRPHGDHDRARLDDAGIDLDTAHMSAIPTADETGDPPGAQLSATRLRCRHHGRGEGARWYD